MSLVFCTRGQPASFFLSGWVCVLGFLFRVYARIFGAKKSVCMSLAILGLTFLAISLVRTFGFFYPIGILLGLATGMYLPAAIPLLTDYYDQGQWGKVIAIHDSGAALSMSATPFIAVILLLFLPWRGMLVPSPSSIFWWPSFFTRSRMM